jgi:hypothetical protein
MSHPASFGSQCAKHDVRWVASPFLRERGRVRVILWAAQLLEQRTPHLSPLPLLKRRGDKTALQPEAMDSDAYSVARVLAPKTL